MTRAYEKFRFRIQCKVWILILKALRKDTFNPVADSHVWDNARHARIQKIFSRGVQVSRRGLTENFNMAKINNLAIQGGSGPPVPPSGSAHARFGREHLSRLVGKPTMWFPNRSDTNRPAQSQKQARSLIFWSYVEEELYYPSSENKGAVT